MTELIFNRVPLRVKSLIILIRILPVLSWGITSSLVGIGFAKLAGYKIDWFDYGLILVLIILIHGILSHAVNDQEDWLSGTDQLSPGILSGGSGVLANSDYSIKDLSSIAWAAILSACIIVLYLTWQVGPSILLLFAVGFWSAIGYSCAPFRLSSRPFAGEWLCGFPAVFACAVGTFYVLTKEIQIIILIAGAIHALLAIGLLMHHHLSDISSDLQATPCKLTTVAMVAINLGMAKTPLVEFIYFGLALLLGIIGALFFHPVFWAAVLVSLACMVIALFTSPEDIPNITAQEYRLYGLIIGQAIIQTAVLFYWPR